MVSEPRPAGRPLKASFPLSSLPDAPPLLFFFAQFWEAAQKRPSYEAAGVTDELPMKMRVMMFIGSMVWKAKAAVVPKWKEAMAEADRQVKEAKKAVSEQMKDAKKAVSENLDRAIGAKK